MIDRQRLIFRKLGGKFDELEFWIGAEMVVKVQNPKQRIIPHDMVHYLVESCFPFDGFVKLVFAGHQPGKVMEVLNGFSPKLPGEYSQTSWITESLVESLQAALWSDSYSFDDFNYAYVKACEARRIEPAAIDSHDFQACVDRVKNLSQRWSKLEVGDIVELEFSRALLTV